MPGTRPGMTSEACSPMCAPLTPHTSPLHSRLQIPVNSKNHPRFYTRTLLPLATPRWLASPDRTALSCPHAEEPRASRVFTRDALWRGVSKHEGTRRPTIVVPAEATQSEGRAAAAEIVTPHFDSRIHPTRCGCTAPCKEQAGNREPFSAPISTPTGWFFAHIRAHTRRGSGHRRHSCRTGPLPLRERAQ
jgi:hypothetical protein